MVIDRYRYGGRIVGFACRVMIVEWQSAKLFPLAIRANPGISSRNQCQGPIFTALDATATHSNTSSRTSLSFERSNGVARRFLFHREPPAYIDSKDRTPADPNRSSSFGSVKSANRFL